MKFSAHPLSLFLNISYKINQKKMSFLQPLLLKKVYKVFLLALSKSVISYFEWTNYDIIFPEINVKYLQHYFVQKNIKHLKDPISFTNFWKKQFVEFHINYLFSYILNYKTKFQLFKIQVLDIDICRYLHKE